MKEFNVPRVQTGNINLKRALLNKDDAMKYYEYEINMKYMIGYFPNNAVFLLSNVLKNRPTF
jgi:hypothetical protein